MAQLDTTQTQHISLHNLSITAITHQNGRCLRMNKAIPAGQIATDAKHVRLSDSDYCLPKEMTN